MNIHEVTNDYNCTTIIISYLDVPNYYIAETKKLFCFKNNYSKKIINIQNSTGNTKLPSKL